MGDSKFINSRYGKTPTRKYRAEQAQNNLFWCGRCKKFFKREMFYKSSNRKYGVSAYCKICKSGVVSRSRKRVKTSDGSFFIDKNRKRSPTHEHREAKAKENLFWCNRCCEFKPRSLFYKNTSQKFGISH